MSESDFLAGLQEILENAYGYAERFHARDLKLTEIDYISDEEQFRAEENYAEETLEIESMPDSALSTYRRYTSRSVGQNFDATAYMGKRTSW
jgi:hypothetical protein